jgi:sugar-specific transcriptional regulator TrmB
MPERKREMDKQQFTEYLLSFGLTRQEAGVYEKLLLNGKQTGYEAAKETGISRSNVYGALAALVEKGAAHVVEGAAKKYMPVPLEEFLENYMKKLEREKSWLLANVPSAKTEEEGYITIEGAQNVYNKMINLLLRAKERVYVSCSGTCLESLIQELEILLTKGKRVVVITDYPAVVKGAEVYVADDRGSQIGIIADSAYVLTGEYGDGSMNTCLYSGQSNFVKVFKSAMANEIKLITIQGGKIK